MNVRDNWRIALLVVFILLATFALFSPTLAASDGGDDNSTVATPAQNATSADGSGNLSVPENGSVNESARANTTVNGSDSVGTSGITNLQYGLDLAGGTRIRAPLVGLTASGLDVADDEQSNVRTTVTNELNLSGPDVNVRLNTGSEGGDSVEVLVGNVSEQQFVSALQAAGLDAATGDVRNGVTDQTLQQTRETVSAKINRGGLSGGQVTVQRSPTGDAFLVIEVPGVERSEVLNLVGDRGAVSIVATYPVETDNGTAYERQTILNNRELERAQIGIANVNDNGVPNVPITLAERDAEAYMNQLNELGFTSGQGIRSCRYESNPDEPGYCLLTVVDEDVVDAHSMGQGLAEMLQSGEFLARPSFEMETPSINQAQRLQINLQAGALPAELNLNEGTQSYLEPSLAQRFKSQALLTGLVAWMMVSIVVFLRYKQPRVAVPMLLTAMAEVYLLLGFAAAIGLPLDLSHIAGFIAVIGTGVDDLLIIADEILQQGKIATGRVFQSRFRKAFWVIGAAAITTIIAMSPLAFLSLGDLTGFAIVTIVGVLIGVLVTRPAYGDVLRNLMLDLDD